MFEPLALYRDLTPAAIGSLLFPLGLVTGSFTSVISARLPAGRSVIRPRSHCPRCRHPLGLADLVPLASYMWNRGRCRYCATAISWRYLALELGCGLLAAGAGGVGGWLAGGAVLVAWPLLFGLAGLWKRVARTLRESQSGFSLLEVLVAMLLLTVALLPVLDVMAVAREADGAAQRRTLAAGLARARYSQVAYAGAAGGATAMDGLAGTIDGTAVSADAALGIYQVQTQVLADLGSANLRTVRVTVTCPTCRNRFGQALTPVTLTGVAKGD